MTTWASKIIQAPTFYGGLEPGAVPLYTLAAASRYLGIPASTVRWWVKGRQEVGYEPVVANVGSGLLSFNDLVELYVIKQLRIVHRVSLRAIRRSVEYAEKQGIPRVLLSDDLATLGGSVLLDHLDELVAISKSGQLALREIIESSMQRVDRSASRLPTTLHPDFHGESKVGGLFPVSVSPLVAFGQPTVTGTGIKTGVVAARIDSGETVEQVAKDYDLSPALIRNAIVFENAA